MESRIKEIREENNLTQEEFGKLFAVGDTTVSGWENDIDSIPLEQLVDISNRFNYSIDYILCLNKTNIKYTKAVINPQVIGKNIKNLRKSNFITQEQMADACGYTNVTQSNYERGFHTITGFNLYTICKKYHVSMDKMLGRTYLEDTK